MNGAGCVSHLDGEGVREFNVEEDRKVWTEEASEIYRRLSAVAVPSRAEQMATVLALLPFGREASFRAVDLASGEGPLSYALLAAFPNSTVLALDGSASMRHRAQAHLQRFGSRAQVAAFELGSPDWYPYLEGAACAVSSLCVHHLRGEQKQRLFAAVYARLASPGALILADLIEPQRAEGREVFRGQLDGRAREQASAAGAPEIYAQYQERGWNHYRCPSPRDHPSGLFEQLQWLSEAGFEAVDCFWLRAGHAVYGGYKGRGDGARPALGYEDACESAREALRAIAEG
jgi:SAM-dependent methyltransferase